MLEKKLKKKKSFKLSKSITPAAAAGAQVPSATLTGVLSPSRGGDPITALSQHLCPFPEAVDVLELGWAGSARGWCHTGTPQGPLM